MQKMSANLPSTLALTLVLGACGDSGYSLSEGGGPGGPDDDPTDGYFGEPDPTEGGACPLAADVCSYGPEGTERSMWACAGNANYELIDLGPTDDTLITFGYPLTLSGQYGGTPIVYACCDDDAASEWCGGILPSQRKHARKTAHSNYAVKWS